MIYFWLNKNKVEQISGWKKKKKKTSHRCLKSNPQIQQADILPLGKH